MAILPIYNITPFTMLDFPDKAACIIWFSGCNMRCPYCHNPDIVRAGGKGRMSIDDVFDFLKKREGLLDGVVLSGGEATLYPDIIDFARQIKAMGFAVKLDTNGTRPKIVKQLVEENLVDYIALDYKAPRAKIKEVTSIDKFDEFEETVSFLCGQNKTPFEVRTTVHTDLLNEGDILEIAEDLKDKHYTGTYYVQNFQGNDETLKNLPEQAGQLDIRQLTAAAAITINCRNF